MFQRRPTNLWTLYLLVTLYCTLKRHLVGEKAIHGTEHIFEYYLYSFPFFLSVPILGIFHIPNFNRSNSYW